MEVYDAKLMPLSSNEDLRKVQEKIINGEGLSFKEKIIAGRDHIIKEINGYKLKSDHVYRAVSIQLLNIYMNQGYILGHGDDDEYLIFKDRGEFQHNNKGVDWYLGGACLRYGDYIIECPCDKNYFFPAIDNGNSLSYDPTVKFFKSSGSKNPVPVSLITNVFDVRELKKNLLEESIMKSKGISK